MMKLLILLLSCIDCIQAYVTVTVPNKGRDLVCNSTVTVTCVIQPHSSTMTWQIDDTIIADCAFGTCQTYTTSFTGLAFSFDTNDSVYTVTVDPLVSAYTGKTFKCDDGYTSDSHTLTMKVLPSVGSATLSVLRNSSGTLIAASTGCIDMVDDVNITIQYYKEDGSHALGADQGSTAIQSCNDELCGGPGIMTLTLTTILQEDEDGESVYPQVIISYPGINDVVQTSNQRVKLKLSETTEMTSSVMDINKTFRFPILLLAVVVILQHLDV